MAMILEKERAIGLKVKILQGEIRVTDFQYANGSRPIEEQVQDFLEENPDILITSIKQSSAGTGEDDLGSTTTISIWYKY